MTLQILVPSLGESVVEATVGKWQKQAGDAVAAGETLVELETDKINLEVSAEQAGVLTSITAATGAEVRIGDVLGLLEPGAVAATTMPPSVIHESKATPVAKRVAEAEGVNLAEVSSSDGGRIKRNDVEQFVAAHQAPPAPIVAPASVITPDLQGLKNLAGLTATTTVQPTVPSLFFPDTSARETRTRMSRRRQTIAKRLVEAQQTAAMLTTFNEVDMSAVMAVRNRRKDAFFEKHKARLGFMSFFVKASVAALKAYPLVNASIEGNDIVTKHYYDIGIAVGAEEGLVVPVLREADRMNFAQIENNIVELAKKARANTLSLGDLQGGTFTITNGGVFGSLLSTPILNPPQVGILGLHKIEERPIALKGEVVIRPMMYVAMSYDHRIIDGSEAVRFLVRIKELMEDPEALLLEG